MRIAVDLRSLSTEASRRGMGKYTQQQLEAVLRVDTKNQYIGVLHYGLDRGLDLTYLRSRPNFRFVAINLDIDYLSKILTISDQFRYIDTLNDLLSAHRIDVFHHTTPFISPNARYVSGVATVSTLYDLIPLIYASDYLDNEQVRCEYFEQTQTIHESHVIAISNSTKRDLISYLDFPESAISVAYPLIDDHFKPISHNACDVALKKLKADNDFPSRFILSVTGIHRSKNLAHLLRAYEHWRRVTQEEISLLIVLPSRFAEEYFRLYFKTPPGVFYVCDVSNEQLVAV